MPCARRFGSRPSRRRYWHWRWSAATATTRRSAASASGSSASGPGDPPHARLGVADRSLARRAESAAAEDCGADGDRRGSPAVPPRPRRSLAGVFVIVGIAQGILGRLTLAPRAWRPLAPTSLDRGRAAGGGDPEPRGSLASSGVSSRFRRSAHRSDRIGQSRLRRLRVVRPVSQPRRHSRKRAPGHPRASVRRFSCVWDG